MKISIHIKLLIKSNPKYSKRLHKLVLWRDSLQHLYYNRFISNFPSHTIRLSLLRMAGAKISKTAAIHSGCTFWNPGGLVLGEGSTVGFRCNLDARKGLLIQENVCLASEVMIWSLHHDYNSSKFESFGGPVCIGAFSWLCSRSIILPNVTIAEGCVIASNAVVVKDTEPYSIMGGVPAKKIGGRDKKAYDYIPASYKLHIV